MQINFYPEALDEYSESLTWYRQRSDYAATKFESAVADAVNRIAADPNRFVLVEGGARACSMGRLPYLIIFYIEPEFVSIAAIAHQSRQPGYWLSRRAPE